jgi:hypothetical protein
MIDRSIAGTAKKPREYMAIDLNYPGISRRDHGLGEQSPVYTIDNFLTPEECWALRDEAEGLLERSKTHSAPQGGTAQSSGRTSYTCHLDKKAPACPPLLTKVGRAARSGARLGRRPRSRAPRAPGASASQRSQDRSALSPCVSSPSQAATSVMTGRVRLGGASALRD